MDDSIKNQFDGQKAIRQDERRTALHAANAESKTVGEWCNSVGLAFGVMNEGQHWRVAGAPGVYLDWWPSSGRMIRHPGKDRIRVPTISDFKDAVADHWGLSRW